MPSAAGKLEPQAIRLAPNVPMMRARKSCGVDLPAVAAVILVGLVVGAVVRDRRLHAREDDEDDDAPASPPPAEPPPAD